MRRLSKRRLILLLVGIAAVICLLILGGDLLEQRSQNKESRGDLKQDLLFEETQEINGVTYRARRDVTTILLLGIDHDSDEVIVSRNYRNGNRADFLRLLVLDGEKQQVTQIQIDRDTMTPITILSVLGKKSGVRNAQIALSYTIGDGQELSSSLTADAVSNLLMGAKIDFYLTMSMDGISALNEAVGGVTVEIEDDFSALDETMVPGATVTLHGDQAELFVRSRRAIGVGTNEMRLRRQETYMSGLISLLMEKENENKEFIGTLFDSLSPYMITNIKRARLVNEVWAARNYDHSRIIQLPGERRVNDTDPSAPTVEFYPDLEAIQDIVTDLFYEEVK